MWTPRRVYLLVAGFVACIATFGVYYRLLGWIDGLPVLPTRFLASTHVGVDNDLKIDEPLMQRYLKQAFGERCAELAYPIKVNIQEVLLATDQVSFEPDGRLRLSPLSAAVFKKRTEDFREIQTIHCDVAYITFDRKIETLSDMAKGKIVAAEFLADKNNLTGDKRAGAIRLVHNHSTPQSDDDLVITMPGPLYFRDRTPGQAADVPQLWTRSFVDLTDYQSKPPHLVKAQGMNLFLSEGAIPAPNRADSKAAKSGQIVKKLELNNVDMKLTLEDQSAFPAGNRPVQPTGRLPTGDKSFLLIKTLGPFRYDLEKDLATFDIPTASADGVPQYVEVIRASKSAGNDVVQCDHLEVQFRKKGAASAAPGQSKAENFGGTLEISEARATGKNVVLISDSEKLTAHGNCLAFHQAARTNVMRGNPLIAVRDGTKIQAVELELRQIDPAIVRRATPEQPVTVATAKGPGIVWMLDRDNHRTAEARWADELKLDRWPEMDRIHLTGGAAFEDREHGQLLQGDQIKVWLAAAGGPTATTSVEPLDQSRSRPRQVRVIGNVRAKTPELKIDKTVLLDIWFHDVPALPSVKPGASPADRGIAVGSAVVPPLIGPPSATPPKLPVPPTPTRPAQKPLEVNAQVIEVFVLRAGPRNELDKVFCHERVTVHQDSTKVGERGLDVSASELTLTHTSDGDILELSAKRPALAKVESQQLMVYGHQIVFDQKENRAVVDGPGNLKMWAATTLNGESRSAPVPINVFWIDRMTFDGTIVQFQGGVQATQEGTKVLCPKMDVFLDRVISLNRIRSAKSATGQADDQPKIIKVFCHNGGQPAAAPVTVTDEVYERNRLVRFQRIDAPEVTYDNDQGIVRAPGRGEVRTLQPGEKNSGDPFTANSKPGEATELEMKLIRVRFEDRLELSTKLRTARFYRNIHAVYIPTENPNLAIDENRLPAAAFAMRCDRLEVASNVANGQSLPSMKADGHADLSSREFSGRADTIKYDEGRDKKQQVIFESTTSAPASLSRIPSPGAQPQELLGKSIYYWRRTNEFKVIGAVGASGTQ